MSYHCNVKGGQCDFANCIGCCTISACARSIATSTPANLHLTNADRIRAMTDEELAKALNAFTAYFESCNRSADEIDCKDCELYKLCTIFEGKAMEWLQQPCGGADHAD